MRRGCWTRCKRCVQLVSTPGRRLLSGRVNLQLLDVTDHTSPSRRTILYVMIKLAAASRRFPSSIYVRDIDVGQVRDPTRFGGYADIFEARHRGRPVALKRLRALTTRESDLHKVRQTKLSRDSRLTSLLESLQRSPRLAPTRASLHPPIHWHRRRHLCFGWLHLPRFTLDASWHFEAIHELCGL
jgi:hypothetical protein